jgi:tetratricopeptide (TPR) repeat protein
LLFRIHFLGKLAPEEKFHEVSGPQIVLSAIALVARYVWKLIWPVRLCAFYVFHPSTSPFGLPVLAGLSALLAFAALFFVCWRNRERNVRFVSFAILWFFATLAPVLNAHWLGENVFTERYLYLPSVGVAWLVGLGASKLWSRTAMRPAERRALLLAGVAIGALFAARIVTRNRDWNNDFVLYNRTLAFSPDARLIRDNLGAAYWKAGDLDKYEALWGGVLAKKPDDPVALHHLGLLADRRHQYAEAKGFFQRAIELDPAAAEPHLHLGYTYLEMGLRGPAELQFRAEIALSPNDIRGRNALGQLLFDLGRSNEAEEQFRASVRIMPNPLAYDFLGMFNIRRGAVREAARDFRAALTLAESDSYAHFGLGDIYRAAGRKAEALSQYQAGLVKDPANAKALAAVQELRQQSARTTP